MVRPLLAGLAAAAVAVVAASLSPVRAEPSIPTRLVPAADRDAWEAAGFPVVVVLPDHLGLDERADFHTQALLDQGIAALRFEVPVLPVIDPSVGLTSPDADPRPAERLLRPLFAALAALHAGHPGRRVGVIGFGAGGEAAALAAHEAVAREFLPGPDAPRFRAHAVFYPTCRGPLLPALRRSEARTTTAPILVLLPHAGGPGDDPDGCGVLFDWTDRSRPDPFVVRAYPWLHHSFDLWPAKAAVTAARRGLPFPSGMDPARFDAGMAELARREVAAIFIPALAPGRR